MVFVMIVMGLSLVASMSYARGGGGGHGGGGGGHGGGHSGGFSGGHSSGFSGGARGFSGGGYSQHASLAAPRSYSGGGYRSYSGGAGTEAVMAADIAADIAEVMLRGIITEGTIIRGGYYGGYGRYYYRGYAPYGAAFGFFLGGVVVGGVI